MGLFDRVVCRYPLPAHPELQNVEFQTKDLGCGMDTYTITAAGRLTIEKRHERFLWPDVGSATGGFTFHDFDTSTMRLVEFRATFLNGRLMRIEHVRSQSFAAEGGA